MNLRRSRISGLTLVEMLIAVTLLTIVSILTMIAFQTAMRSRGVAEERVDLYERARSSMDLISNDLRTARLSRQSVMELSSPWDENNPIPRFVGINRVFDYPYVSRPIGEPREAQLQLNTANPNSPYIVEQYPRDLLSFASTQDFPGALDDTVHIAYTCVRNWQVDESVEGTQRMTLVRGVSTTRRDTETGEIVNPSFKTPLKDVEDDSMVWSAVSENVWGVDFQYFTYDFASGQWTQDEQNANSEIAVNLAWSEGLHEWHSGAESWAFGAQITDSELLSEYNFRFDERQPMLQDTPSGSFYPMFHPFPLEPFIKHYYSEDGFFLSNEEEDGPFGQKYRDYLSNITDQAPTMNEFNELVKRRDGLPQLVQITLWLQPGDEPALLDYGDGREHPDERFWPIMVQTRVYLSQSSD